jgi:hypothetical protein
VLLVQCAGKGYRHSAALNGAQCFGSFQSPSATPDPFLRGTHWRVSLSRSPAKVCRGVLGFRARKTRKQEYSVEKDPSAGAPSQRQPQSKTKANSIQGSEKLINTDRPEEHFRGKDHYGGDCPGRFYCAA